MVLSRCSLMVLVKCVLVRSMVLVDGVVLVLF